MNVPKLRFKEFNDEWQNGKLEDVVDFLDDRRKPIKDSDRNNIKGIYPYYGASGIIDYINDYIFDENLLLLGEDGANIISRSTKLVFKATGKYWVNNHAHVLKPKENYNIDFLESYLENINYEPYNTGTAQPKLNQEVCRKINIKTPSLNEQAKIGKTLSLLDKKIELQTKKIEDLKLFKKGLLDIIYKNNITNKVSLKEILEEYNEKSTINNQYEILSSTSNGLFLQSEYFNKQAASENNIGYKIIKRNQLVLSPQNLWMGNININNDFNFGIVSPSYKVFTLNESIIDKDYFESWIKSPRALYEYMISSEQGASIVRRNLNLDMFYEITINLPDIKTQKYIGNKINNINIKIKIENNKLNKLQELKKGLMQNMFV